jgi:hypothetical protein
MIISRWRHLAPVRPLNYAIITSSLLAFDTFDKKQQPIQQPSYVAQLQLLATKVT